MSAEVVERGCDWPVPSGFREPVMRTCGRGGSVSRHSGISLCWQHNEIWMRELVGRITDGHLHAGELNAVCEALLTRLGDEPDAVVGDESGSGWSEADGYAVAWRDLAEELLVRQIERMAASELFRVAPRSGWGRGRAITALDRLIEQRIAATWGESA